MWVKFPPGYDPSKDTALFYHFWMKKDVLWYRKKVDEISHITEFMIVSQCSNARENEKKGVNATF